MPIRVYLIGNPNTGKSTLFGVLSGHFARTANYPGVTVDKHSIAVNWTVPDLIAGNGSTEHALELIDLPGTYSLVPRSPDELLAVRELTTVANAGQEVIVCVASALALERNLFLFSQLLELGKPLVLAINMVDVSESRGQKIDADRLSAQLCVPVVLTAAARRCGLDELRRAILREAAKSDSSSSRERMRTQLTMPSPFYAAVDGLLQSRPELLQGDVTRFIVERAILEPGGTSERKLLAAAGEGIRGNFKEAREAIEQHCGPLASLESQSRYQWIRPRIEGAITGGKLGSTWTDWLDQLLTGRWTGLLLFALLMLGVFQLVFTVSKPLMEVCESAQGWISEQIVAVLPQGVLQSLLVNGVIAGVGSVLIFVPQIAFLFLVIGILEDCGYMARAAFLSDRLMSIFGLSGKSFLPLFSSFGCAVPGIMAARVIENRWERIVTILIAPLMSCSARLPVYVLLIAAMVPATTVVGGWIQLQALVLFSMYLVGVLVALPTAWVMRRLFFAGESAPFILELPEYKVPDYRVVLGRVVDSVRDFVTNAGTFIFAATILIWAAAYWPGDHSQAEALQRQLGALEDQDSPEGIVLAESLHREESKLIENSYLGRLGKSIEPIVRPMGWDWKLGVGALASFPAREVIVATLGTIYSLGGDVDEEHPGLIEALRSARWPDGRPVYTTAVALSVMVFFALCAQCASTLAIMRRETQSYRWPIFSFIYMTTLAYVAAIATYQLAS